MLDIMRGENGVRLKNCRENIGKMAYSFNKLQVAALPRELQPPLACIAERKFSVQSRGSKRFLRDTRSQKGGVWLC